jgi:hypothetical protein
MKLTPTIITRNHLAGISDAQSSIAYRADMMDIPIPNADGVPAALQNERGGLLGRCELRLQPDAIALGEWRSARLGRGPLLGKDSSRRRVPELDTVEFSQCRERCWNRKDERVQEADARTKRAEIMRRGISISIGRKCGSGRCRGVGFNCWRIHARGRSRCGATQMYVPE